MAGHALRREVRQSSIAPHRTLWRAQSRLAIPLHVTPHASSPPNHPTRSVRMQKPPRASRNTIAARAPIHGLPFAYGIPHVLPPRPSSQISPHTKRAAHILPSVSARGALSWPDALREGRSAVLRRVPSHVMARPITARHSPACDAPRILPAKPSDQISSNAKAAARITEHDRGPRPNPRSAFCIWNSACSSPQGRPAKSALTQNAPRTSCPLNARRIVMARRAPRWALSSPYCASSRVIERHTAAPAFPLLPVFFPPKLSGQITPTRQLQHFIPPYDFLTKRKNHRAIPAFWGLRGGSSY